MAALTVQEIPALYGSGSSNGGVTTSEITPELAGDNFVNDGNTRLRISVTNETAAVATFVVVQSQVKSDQGFTNHAVFEVAKNTSKVTPPFPISRFSDENGNCQVRYYKDADKAKAFSAEAGDRLAANEIAEVSLEVISG